MCAHFSKLNVIDTFFCQCDAINYTIHRWNALDIMMSRFRVMNFVRFSIVPCAQQ